MTTCVDALLTAFHAAACFAVRAASACTSHQSLATDSVPVSSDTPALPLSPEPKKTGLKGTKCAALSFKMNFSDAASTRGSTGSR